VEALTVNGYLLMCNVNSFVDFAATCQN